MDASVERRRRLYVFFYVGKTPPEFERLIVDLADTHDLVGFVRRLTTTAYDVTAEGRHDDLTRFLDRLPLLPTEEQPLVLDVRWTESTGEHDRFMTLGHGA